MCMYIGSMWEVYLLLTYLSQSVFLGKSGVYYTIEKQYPGISWIFLFAIPNLSTSFNARGRNVMAFILFHKAG